VVLLLASSAAALTSLGVGRAMQSGNSAAFVSQSVPATMTAGQAYTVTVTMLNQGTTTWTEANHYRLGSQNPENNGTWRDGRVYLEAGESVAPGAQKTFSFQVVAPGSPGSYNFQWQMVRELVEWFGPKTPNVAVQVVPGPATSNPPLTKLKEYVYAGSRLIMSEEKSCVPTLSPASASAPTAGGTGSFNVSTSSGCNWTATSDSSWITITGPASGAANGAVSYSVAANSGPQRSGTISVNGRAFNITQALNPASCSYSLNVTGVSSSEQASSGSFTLTTGAGCPWNASSNASWLTVTSPASGAGSTTINYSIAANAGQQRSGVITVGGKTFTVTQAPNQASCTFALSPSSWMYGTGPNGGFFSVTTGPGCHWDAATTVGWLTVTGGAVGTGNGGVSFSVQANNDGSRTGIISVRGQPFTVTQCGYLLSREWDGFGSGGGVSSVAVSAAGGCAWSATSNAGWIVITSGANGSGNGSVSYAVDPYFVSNGYQFGTITVAGRTVGIEQFGPTQPPPPPECCFNEIPCECPPEWLTASGSSATETELRGLTARYFRNTTLYGQPTIERIDPVVNINWTGKRPDDLPPAERFSARWSGRLSAPTSEAYTFYLYSDDGARLWVNNQLVIDRWQTPFESHTRSAPVELKAGEKADVRVEYYSAGGGAEVRLLWSSASTPKQIIPQNQLYPEAGADKSAPTDTNKQTGMLLPPGFDAGWRAALTQWSAMSRLSAGALGRLGLGLLIAGVGFAVLLHFNWPQLRRRCATAAAFVLSRLRDQIAWLGAVMRIGRRKVARLSIGIARIVARRGLSLWRASGCARLKPVLRRALVIAVIVSLAAPLSPAQAEGLVLAAQTAWREVSAYAGVAKRSVKIASGARPVKPISVASQTEQVNELQVCPRSLVMFVDERYTLTPVALAIAPDDSRQVVHGAAMSWSSLNDGVAEVSSFGQVKAKGEGTTSVVVQSGSVTKQIPIEVRRGTRPTSSNQDADIDPTGDCSSEQSSMYASKSVAAALPQQDLIGLDGVTFDWDPTSRINSRAAHFRNAVGNPRFTARSQSAAAVPTSTQLGSYNYQFNAPVVSVGGRGASASIGMTLNSRVWNVDDGKLTFNYVGAYPAPGWTMGYGKIIRNYNATATGDGSGVGSGNNPGDYLLVTGDGTRIRLAARYEANRWIHESDDGSFLQFDMRSGEMRYPDGSKMIYSSVNGCLLPTAKIGANGGAITMTYRDYCEGQSCLRVFRHRTALSAVRDTLGRYVTFHYYGDADYQAAAAQGRPAGELAAIKAPDRDGVQQEVIQAQYQPITLKYDFGALAVDAPANNSQIQVVRRIYYPQTGRGFLFLDYSSYGMSRKISRRANMRGAGDVITDGTEIAYTTYNYTTIDPNDPYGRNQVGSLNDFPQFTRREEWWQGKTDAMGAPTTATTKYDYSRTADALTEVMTMKYVDKNCEEVTTMGTDSAQLSFGKTVSVELKKSSTGEVLSKQVYTYVAGPDEEVEVEKIETIDEAGQGRMVRLSYGRYGRVSDKYEYGYKQGGAYQARRRTHYDYIDDTIYVGARFLRLASRVSVYDAKNNNDDTDDELKAKTETFYDDYAAMGGMQSYGLNSSLYPPNHDAAYDQNNVIRGNATALKTFSSFNPEKATTRGVRYDIFGNIVEADVSCCVKKTFDFSRETAFSQPDLVRSGPETGFSLQTNYEYNYFTGLVDNETNPDGLRTLYDYDRALRLKKVTNEATGAETETSFQDSNGNDLLDYTNQTTYDDQGTTKVVTSRQWFDGSGRVIRTGTGEGDVPNSYDITATVYDGWGRVTKRSNPYPGDASGNPQAGAAQFWTINTYDELSRVSRVTLPDTQFIQTDYAGATATRGATTTTTDTVGRARKREVDGLGRLVKVIEQNPANGNLEWETVYNYDALGNLIQTNQGGQLRTFKYDAKSRLTSEKTPEAGTIAYTYTDFDALETRTDDRGVITTYQYGPLNLLTGVSYNNVTGVEPTAPVIITYKSSSKGKGQIETVADGAGSESYGYDDLGRLQSSVRVIDGISYERRYEYNAAGQMTLMTYPSGKRVKVGRDARGRLSTLQRVDASGGAQETYLSGVNYRVDGLISSQQLGSGATESFGYSDDRLQLTSQTVMKGNATLLNLIYGYGAGAEQMGSGSKPGNGGQVVSVNGTINGQNRNQTFTYDNVGRLMTATGWGAWARRYDYDRFGNQTLTRDAVSGGNPLQNTLIEQVAGIQTNRIASVNGMAFGYDARGNVISDGVRGYKYDAENRIVSVNVNGSSSESYSYDASNHRVKKIVGGVVTHYIWEGNQVIAEYERGGNFTQGTGTRYYHQDRQSTRVITDGAGSVVGTTNQLPFGEEFGPSGEEEKHKFTTYERDGAGIDYAVNRHYDPRQGRFNQADPLGIGAASLADPQSLNLYSYVGNDPVNYTDPSGLFKPSQAYWDAVQAMMDFLDFYFRAMEFHSGGGPITPQEPVRLPDISTPQVPPPPMPPPPMLKNPPRFNFDGNCGVNPLTGDPGFTEQEKKDWGTTVGGYAKGDNGDPRYDSSRRHGTHHGVDLHAGSDGRDAVVANRDGTITAANFSGRGGAGNLIFINHGDGQETRYLHLDSINVRIGQTVKQGEVISYSGVSGRAAGVTDPHLHFEIRIGGRDVNPVSYFNSSCPPAPPAPPRR
jgi:RHS repeat-associated protein